jgi:hypothetical protein
MIRSAVGWPLLNHTMHDGSRHFAALPETYDAERPQWERLRESVGMLPGASLTKFVTDDVTEAWIEFVYRQQRFSINDQHGEWWFFVSDPSCPDEVLESVVAHFEPILSRLQK